METSIHTPRGAVLIRPARLDDAQAYRHLRLEALRSHPEAFSADAEAAADRGLAEWEDQLRSLGNTAFIYFATHDSELIGMCGLYWEKSSKTRHSGTIWGVYLRPDWRGLHLADELISHCLTWGREHGMKIVKLGVATTNAPAVACYLRCGFQIYGVEPQAIWVNETMIDEMLMARPL